MIAQMIDLFALQDMVIASALPKPIPALAALEVCGVAVIAIPPDTFGGAMSGDFERIQNNDPFRLYQESAGIRRPR
jgi:hypothetical protein